MEAKLYVDAHSALASSKRARGQRRPTRVLPEFLHLQVLGSYREENRACAKGRLMPLKAEGCVLWQ
jgi:hypothetical protein